MLLQVNQFRSLPICLARPALSNSAGSACKPTDEPRQPEAKHRRLLGLLSRFTIPSPRHFALLRQTRDQAGFGCLRAIWLGIALVRVALGLVSSPIKVGSRRIMAVFEARQRFQRKAGSS